MENKLSGALKKMSDEYLVPGTVLELEKLMQPKRATWSAITMVSFILLLAYYFASSSIFRDELLRPDVIKKLTSLVLQILLRCSKTMFKIQSTPFLNS
jgi:hypothetical protein